MKKEKNTDRHKQFFGKKYDTKRLPEKMLIFGFHPVLEAIEAGVVLEKVFVRRDMRSHICNEIISKLANSGVFVQRVPVEKLNKMTDRNHQGVIAIISQIEYVSIETIVQSCFDNGKLPLLIILDGVVDVRNFGAIARTAACAGADAMVIPQNCNAKITKDAIKTSSGALVSLPICRTTNLDNTVRYLKESGLQILAASEHGTTCYTDCNLKLPTAIILGNEANGISNTLLHQTEKQICIPMYGKIESLNVSVAAGILLYETVRQRNLTNPNV